MESDLIRLWIIDSLQISKLTNKKHFTVLRDIRKLLKAKNLGKYSGVCTYKDKQWKERTKYQLPKPLALTLLFGYSPEFWVEYTNRIEKRLDEVIQENIVLVKQLNPNSFSTDTNKVLYDNWFANRILF